MAEGMSEVDRHGLPIGVATVAARITTGTSVHGWDRERDGVPDSVYALYERHGTEGLRAVRCLMDDIYERNDRSVVTALADRLTRWAAGHYVGCGYAYGYDAKIWARAKITEQHLGPRLEQAMAPVTGEMDWAYAVEWRHVAREAEGAGLIRIATEVKDITEEKEVDGHRVGPINKIEAHAFLFTLEGGDWDTYHDIGREQQ